MNVSPVDSDFQGSLTSTKVQNFQPSTARSTLEKRLSKAAKQQNKPGGGGEFRPLSKKISREKKSVGRAKPDLQPPCSDRASQKPSLREMGLGLSLGDPRAGMLSGRLSTASFKPFNPPA